MPFLNPARCCDILGSNLGPLLLTPCNIPVLEICSALALVGSWVPGSFRVEGAPHGGHIGKVMVQPFMDAEISPLYESKNGTRQSRFLCRGLIAKPV